MTLANNAVVAARGAGAWHSRLRALSMYDQLLSVVPEIGRGRTWTFYPARPGEHDIGDAFQSIFEVLLERHRPRVIAQLRDWLESDDEHLKWLAAEVVGFFRVAELKENLPGLFEGAAPESSMGTLAAKRPLGLLTFCGLPSCAEPLTKTRDAQNQEWLLFVYPQMLKERPSAETARQFERYIDEFLSLNPAVTSRIEDRAAEAKASVHRYLEGLDQKGSL